MNCRRRKKAFKKMINFEPMTDNEYWAAIDFAVRNFGSLSKPMLIAEQLRVNRIKAAIAAMHDDLYLSFSKEAKGK